jgi:hypothetical protein
MNTNTSDQHEDLKRAAKNAIVAYMHHRFYEHHQGNTTSLRVIHAAADYCLNNAVGIVDKAISQLQEKRA